MGIIPGGIKSLHEVSVCVSSSKPGGMKLPDGRGDDKEQAIKIKQYQNPLTIKNWTKVTGLATNYLASLKDWEFLKYLLLYCLFKPALEFFSHTMGLKPKTA